jgi:O-antigen/teichoic acid export membrane protein
MRDQLMLRVISGSAAVRISGAAAQLLLTILITHVAGVNESGHYFLGFSILMIIGTLSRLGCELSGLREIAAVASTRDASSARTIVATRIAVVLASGSLAGAVLAALAAPIARGTFGTQLVPTLLMVAATVAPFALLNLLAELLKGLGQSVFAIVLQNLVVPLTTGVGLGLLLIGGVDVTSNWLTAINGLAVLVGLAMGIAAVGGVGNGRPSRLGGWSDIDPSLIRRIVCEAPSLLIVSMVIVVMQWIGATVLGATGTPRDVAGYGVAARISIAVSIIHSAASSVVAPRMAVAHANANFSLLARVSRRTGLTIALITWPILTLLFIMAPTALSLFGSSYVDFVPVLRLLLVGQFVAGLIGHSGMVLVMAGEYRAALANSLAAVAAILVLSPLLTQGYGATGAASAMSVSVVVGHLVAVVLVRWRLGFWTVGFEARSAVAERVS